MAHNGKLIVTVRAEQEPRRYWCDDCMTSGGLEFDIYCGKPGEELRKGGVYQRCLTCKPLQEEDNDQPE